MAEITLNNLHKTYDDGTKALKGIDLTIADHDFLVLLGPSGCGKSTMLRQIADWKIAYIKEAHKQLGIDTIFYHDDWGSKQNLFLPPDVWRDIIKPLQKEISDTMHELGIFYMHHADCICQPIVTDMVEIGVQLWQGTIAQNDIVEIQRITEGKLPMCGGIDGPKLDVSYTTEEQARAEVRRAIDTYCAAGRFFPSIPNGVCFIEEINGWVMDELDKYGHEYVKLHPRDTWK